MVPFSKVSFNLLKTYSKWNLQVLKGDRALWKKELGLF
jgi:hypothetical protein